MSETPQKTLPELLDDIELRWRRADKDFGSSHSTKNHCQCSGCRSRRDLPPLVKALRITLSPPQCPWPNDVWPLNIQQAGEAMCEQMGAADTTAISDALMRHGWELAINAIVKAIEESVADSVSNAPKSELGSE